jgi:hypothetical protein
MSVLIFIGAVSPFVPFVAIVSRFGRSLGLVSTVPAIGNRASYVVAEKVGDMRD